MTIDDKRVKLQLVFYVEFSGTQQVKIDLEQLQTIIIEEQMELLLYTTLLIDSHLIMLKIGMHKWTSHSPLI